MCFGESPAAAQGPIAPRLSSRRVRPWLSRYIDAVVLRVMRLPSVKACVVSVTASAEYGAPFTVLSPKLISLLGHRKFASCERAAWQMHPHHAAVLDRFRVVDHRNEVGYDFVFFPSGLRCRHRRPAVRRTQGTHRPLALLTINGRDDFSG